MDEPVTPPFTKFDYSSGDKNMGKWNDFGLGTEHATLNEMSSVTMWNRRVPPSASVFRIIRQSAAAKINVPRRGDKSLREILRNFDSDCTGIVLEGFIPCQLISP